jgi:hypothetical protein
MREDARMTPIPPEAYEAIDSASPAAAVLVEALEERVAELEDALAAAGGEMPAEDPTVVEAIAELVDEAGADGDEVDA